MRSSIKLIPTTLLLIDGDIPVYAAMALSEHHTAWDKDGEIWSNWTNLSQAQDIFDGLIKKALAPFNYDRVHVCCTGVENFRREVDPSYKSNRPRKPTGFVEFRRRLLEAGSITLYDGIEADDAMGILMTKPGNEKAVIYSADKDMKTIPGRVFTKGKLVTVSEEEADTFWLTQTLTGDVTDGYKGCPGIGAVKAEKILSAGGDQWASVKLAFEKAGLTAADALVQARLARILRWSDWDAVNKKPILWESKQ